MEKKFALAQSKNIESWLKSAGLPAKKLPKDRKGNPHIAAKMKHNYGVYWVDITTQIQSGVISFGAPIPLKLTKGMNATGIKQLYEYALELNSQLNIGSIAFTKGAFFLTHSYSIEDSFEGRFYRDLKNFHKCHELVLSKLAQHARAIRKTPSLA